MTGICFDHALPNDLFSSLGHSSHQITNYNSKIWWRGQAGTERGRDRLQGKRCACPQLPGRAQLRAIPLAAWSPPASSTSAAADNLNSALGAGGGMCHVKAALGGAWKHTLQRVSSAAGFPSLSRGREPFRQPIMMQSAAVFAHAVSLSFLNCTIHLQLLSCSFQQTACAGKLLRCCQWGSNTSQHSCCEISGSTRSSFWCVQLCW